MVRHLKNFSFWSKRANTIIIVCRILDVQTAHENLLNVMKYLWTKKITNAILTLWNTECKCVNSFTFTALKRQFLVNVTDMIADVMNFKYQTGRKTVFLDKVNRTQMVGQEINIYSFGSNNRKYGINITGKLQ